MLVYYPFVHMVGGGGLLANLGILDYAGGELNVDNITPLAFLNTDISASFAAIT